MQEQRVKQPEKYLSRRKIQRDPTANSLDDGSNPVIERMRVYCCDNKAKIYTFVGAQSRG